MQVFIETIEAFFPEAAVMLDPVGNVAQWRRFKPARAPLSLPSTRNEAGMLQHLQVTGDGRHAHCKWLGEIGDRGLSVDQPREDGAAGWVGEGGEGGAESVGIHLVLNRSVI